MKYRMLDLLQCPCGRSDLVAEEALIQCVSFRDSFSEVRCKKTCAFRQRPVEGENLTPSDCSECYSREIVQGAICCECGRTWPIIEGIPRFLPDTLPKDIKRTQDTFSYEWKMFRFGERNWGQDIEYRKGLFLDAMGASTTDLRGKLIFDAGCGSGVLSIEMAKSFGMEVVALDLAYGIENAHRKNDSPYVHFVQGSVLDPPFRNQVFDRVYCAGVLAHCPDTHLGFRAVMRTLKEGGRYFIWVYHPIDKKFYPTEYRKLAVHNWIRKNVTSRLPITLQYMLYLSTMPAFLVKRWVEKLLGKRQNQVTWREKMQNLFDSFSPIYQHRHEPEEVRGWYTEEGFTNVVVCNKGPQGFGVRGDRSEVIHMESPGVRYVPWQPGL